MRIVNLTGHDLTLGNDDKRVTYPSEGRVRLDTRYKTVDLIPLGDTGLVVPLKELANGQIVSLPPPAEGTLYVVSDLVAKRILRDDVVAPVDFHRGVGGRVEYARSLLRHRKK